MRTFKYKNKRTTNLDEEGHRIPDTFNSTVPELKRYVKKNTQFDIHCANETSGVKCITKAQITKENGKITNCCNPSSYRNPISGYRKYILLPNNNNLETSEIQPNTVCINDPTNTLYKDNWSKSCDGKDENGDFIGNKGCYTNKPPTYIAYNRRGIKNPVYNQYYSQYLQRRIRTFKQLNFNFLSNKPVNGKCGSEFATAAHNSTAIITDISNNTIKNNPEKNNQTPDCVPNCRLGCGDVNEIVDCDIKYVGISPCDTKNNNAIAVYKKRNPKFSKQGAVSGGSRINRLKYQTILKSQSKITKNIVSTKKNNTGSFNSSSKPNAVNGNYPVSLYTNTAPIFKENNNNFCVLRKNKNSFGRKQSCYIKSGLCIPKSLGK